MFGKNWKTTFGGIGMWLTAIAAINALQQAVTELKTKVAGFAAVAAFAGGLAGMFL